MPCHTRRQQTVALEKADLHVLARALENSGYTVSVNEQTKSLNAYNRNTGDVVSYDASSQNLRLPQRLSPNEIKRAYSLESLKTAARKFGFNMQQTEQEAEQNKGHLHRRY